MKTPEEEVKALIEELDDHAIVGSRIAALIAVEKCIDLLNSIYIPGREGMQGIETAIKYWEEMREHLLGK
jgi:hypothetical protein